MVKYYKVVFNNGTQLISAVVSGPYCKVSYAKNVISNSPSAPKRLGRGLLVFANLESAESFAGGCAKHLTGEMEIWECEVTNPRRPQPMCSIYNLIYGVFVQIDQEWPIDTVEVDTVKLTKKVSSDIPKPEFKF